MKFAKIQFESRDTCAKALKGMMTRGRVTMLQNEVFIVPAPALDWLASEQLSYKFLSWMNQDDVVQALRNHLADAV